MDQELEANSAKYIIQSIDEPFNRDESENKSYLTATRERATISMDAPSELVRAIHSIKKEIDRLTLEQSQALQEAVFMGMTPDEAKESEVRVDKIVELIAVLEQLESTVPRFYL